MDGQYAGTTAPLKVFNGPTHLCLVSLLDHGRNESSINGRQRERRG